jgi:hypothetical protein
MMVPGVEPRSLIRVIVGLGCVAGAVVLAGTVAAGLLWSAALAIACLGYGTVVDRLIRRRWSTPITLVTGMAVLLGISTVVAHAHLLTRPVQIAAVPIGILLCTLGGASGDDPNVSIPLRVYVATAAVFAIGIELIAPQVSFADTFNHVLYVKRLWDTGSLGVVHHQLGLQVVGESYLALMTGAGTAGTFELGGCVALLVFVLSFELAKSPSPLAQPLVFLLTLPVVLWPGMSLQWSGVVLYVAMFITLERAREVNVRGWHACVLAIALVMLRHEYLIVALPYLVVAFGPGWSRRNVVIAVALWFAVLIPYQLLLAVAPARALFNAALLVIAMPLVAAARHVLAPRRGPDALGALLFASVMYGLALLFDAIRRAQHGDGAVVTVCFGGAACICWLLARPRNARTIQLGAASVVLALVVAYTITGPAFEDGRWRATNRVIRAVVALRQTLVFGGPHDLEAPVATLQAEVPRGARIGLWGENAGKLDFRRNPVVDLTRSGKRDETMVPMAAAEVRQVDYVLLENLEPATAPDLWNPSSNPTAAVESLLDLRASSDGAVLFRVRR